ncbi:BASS family bile acid:Na+ symporter [Actinocorallia herbida]|uniref:BASS family bile acid:Na+ symporter n=1 Tax=Actinocorallia herbida TaxID=58109 RepID=A0A3N1D161_9ACTN|nr:bile acid:sodium symporter family protein [Actinocorallia herbida]ROO87246.1 BASS family bile acid:Na+ symporter [Actinocorallia herbida]
MDSEVIAASLPYALGVVMFGLGLSLTVDDFLRVGRHPRAVAAALLCQLVVLPVVCFGLVLAFGLPPEPAVGLMLVAASPGGPTANLFSHLFGGHVALNVTLTAVTSALVVITLPIVVNLSTAYFLADGAEVGLQTGKVVQVFMIVVLPVALGMLVRARAPRVARRLDGPVRVLSVVVLVVAIGTVLLGQRENLAGYFVAVGAAALAFNLVSLVAGYAVPRLVGAGHREAVAVGFEIGIHNTAFAMTVALGPALLNNAEMAIPAVVYGVIMFFTAAGFGRLLTRRGPRRSAVDGRAPVGEPG